jgi:hypothetical protein
MHARRFGCGDGINTPLALPLPRDKANEEMVDKALIHLGHYAHFFNDELMHAPRKVGCCPGQNNVIPLPPDLWHQEMEAINCRWWLLFQTWRPRQ